MNRKQKSDIQESDNVVNFLSYKITRISSTLSDKYHIDSERVNAILLDIVEAEFLLPFEIEEVADAFLQIQLTRENSVEEK